MKASTDDILFAIEWLHANESPTESSTLYRVADLLQGIVNQRTRAMVRRQVVAAIEADHPGAKHTRKGKEAIKIATDNALKALSERS